MLWVTDSNFESAWVEPEKNTALYKPKMDYTYYLSQLGAKKLGVYIYTDVNESDDSIRSRTDGILAGFHRGDTLIIQFPLFGLRTKNVEILIDRVHGLFHGKVILFFHDYESILEEPSPDDAQVIPDNEVMHNSSFYDLFVKKADAVIVHSENFKQALVNKLHYDKPVIVQGAFGYRVSDEMMFSRRKFSKNLIYSGNLGGLNKSVFLEDIPDSWEMDVFGPYPSERLLNKSNIHYRGSFRPYELPQHLPDGIGLAWSSESYDEVTGLVGEYTKINYSHKISSYLVAKLPVIVWSQSAPAKWIVESGIGFAIDSLDEVQPLLDNLTEEKYNEMQDNLELVSNLIREGIYTKQAALEAYKAVNQKNYQTKF